jgi:hypothetical protein
VVLFLLFICAISIPLRCLTIIVLFWNLCEIKTETGRSSRPTADGQNFSLFNPSFAYFRLFSVLRKHLGGGAMPSIKIGLGEGGRCRNCPFLETPLVISPSILSPSSPTPSPSTCDTRPISPSLFHPIFHLCPFCLSYFDLLSYALELANWLSGDKKTD